MFLLGIKYFMCDLICNVNGRNAIGLVREEQSCDIRHVTYMMLAYCLFHHCAFVSCKFHS